MEADERHVRSPPPEVRASERHTTLTDTPDTLVELTAYVISACVSNHRLPVADLTGVIAEVHGARGRAASGAAAPAPAPEPQMPAAPIKRSAGPCGLRRRGARDQRHLCLERR